MIQIEFRRRIGWATYSVAGTLCVEDYGSWSLTGGLDESILDIPIPQRREPSGRLRFHDDPARWARLAHREFRTPYFVVVTTEDSPDTPRGEND